ncbi:MAG: glycosyltransferase [bacterium]|jgi:glycosyltransferase involved in cell wall biosynthesis
MAKRVVILGNASSVHIIRWANGIARAGFEVHLISLGGAPIEGINTIIVEPVQFRRLSYITNLMKVKRLIKSLRPDILHSHYATGYGLWGAASGFHPHIITVWGSDILAFPSNFILRAVLKKILLSADCLTAAGKFLCRATAELIPNGKEMVCNVPFGVQLPELVIPRSPDETVKLIYLKGHERIYGPDILLRAMRLALDSMPTLRLTMAGRGRMTPQLRSMADELGLKEAVSFPGFIEHDRVFRLLAEHDLMVMPSRQESFGVAALEASAAGIPVIASAVGGIPEVVIDGATGLLVPPESPERLAEAIVKLAADASLREKLGNAGRKFVAENYRWDDNIKQMIEIYNSLMKSQ